MYTCCFPFIPHYTNELQAKPGHWKTLWETSFYFPETHPTATASVSALGGWWLPEGYFKVAAAHMEDYSMRAFSEWLHSGVLDHAPTTTILGGPYGLKWPVLHLTCAFWTLSQLGDREQPPHRTRILVDTASELQIVNSDIMWLVARLEQLLPLLVSMRHWQFDHMHLGEIPNTCTPMVGTRPSAELIVSTSDGAYHA
jgi:hypothetical protein